VRLHLVGSKVFKHLCVDGQTEPGNARAGRELDVPVCGCCHLCSSQTDSSFPLPHCGLSKRRQKRVDRIGWDKVCLAQSRGRWGPFANSDSLGMRHTPMQTLVSFLLSGLGERDKNSASL